MNKKRAAKGQWKRALNALAMRNRVHVCADMSAAYRELAEFYDQCEIIGFGSGEKCGTWVVPPAWEVDKAVLTGPDGRILADWAEKKLHLFTYSPSFQGSVTLEELQEHLFSMPSKPDRTPFHFRNQYRHWQPEWGFCLPHNVRESLPKGTYHVDIQTRFVPGQMEMVEQVHQGESDVSFLLVGHFDHPEMCNDGLVGCLAGHEVISRLKGRSTHLTYRMLSTVEIIGSVFFAEHHARQRNIRQAMFVASSGARAPLQYQQSFSGESAIDRIARHIFHHYTDDASMVVGFREGEFGNDEIAYDVGGVGIPCGSMLRAPFDEYHTDADNVDSVSDSNFEQSVDLILKMIDVLEGNARLERKFTGLPCLSSPELGLYLSPEFVSNVQVLVDEKPLSWELSPEALKVIPGAASRLNKMMTLLPCMCEGEYTVLDLAERVDLPFEIVSTYTDLWAEKGLLEKHWHHPFQPRDAA